MKTLHIAVAVLLSSISLTASDLPQKLNAYEFDGITFSLTNSIDKSSLSLHEASRLLQKLLKVAHEGSLEQQNKILSVLTTQQQRLNKLLQEQINPLVRALSQNKSVQDCLKKIGRSAFEGALVSLAFHSLIACSSGDTSITQAGCTAAESAVIGAIDSLTSQYYENAAVTRGYISYGAKEMFDRSARFITGSGYTPLSNALMTSIVTTISDALRQTVEQNGGWQTLWNSVEWVGTFENKSISDNSLRTTQQSVLTALTEHFSYVLSDPVLREYLAATTISAVEGAFIGLVLNQLGLGYAGESMIAGISYGALRGALAGLYNYAVYANLNLGIINESASLMLSRSVQKYLTTNSIIDLRDITPNMLHALASSSLNQFLAKSGGMRKTLGNILSYSSSVKWLNFNPFNYTPSIE
jgi:hypothetical protein